MVPRFTHGLQHLPVGAEDLVEGFGEVRQERTAVGDLHGLWCAHARPVDRGFEAISGDHRHAGMRT
jgi:hypothetical protein